MTTRFKLKFGHRTSVYYTKNHNFNFILCRL